MAEQKDTSTLTQEKLLARAAIEKERGIVRDEDGKIVFTKEQLEKRIKHFRVKQEDYKKRSENITINIKEAEEELKE